MTEDSLQRTFDHDAINLTETTEAALMRIAGENVTMSRALKALIADNIRLEKRNTRLHIVAMFFAGCLAASLFVILGS